MKIKILIADDHPIFREGLVKIIDQENSFEILSKCNNGDDAIQKIRELKPDIAIVDISMPGSIT